MLYPIPPLIPSFPLTHWLNRQNRGSRCGVGSTTWVESNLLRLARASEGTASLRGRWLGHRYWNMMTICTYIYILIYKHTLYITLSLSFCIDTTIYLQNRIRIHSNSAIHSLVENTSCFCPKTLQRGTQKGDPTCFGSGTLGISTGEQ